MRCPYCQGDVADDARKCRHCGEWVSTTHAAFRVTVILLMIVALILVMYVVSQPYS